MRFTPAVLLKLRELGSLYKYSDDQPRDDQGRFTDAEGASDRAHELSRTARESGDPADHQAAGEAHEKAANLHYQESARSWQAGDEGGSDEHQRAGQGHDKAASFHAQHSFVAA
jgi:hypothetical protein